MSAPYDAILALCRHETTIVSYVKRNLDRAVIHLDSGSRDFKTVVVDLLLYGSNNVYSQSIRDAMRSLCDYYLPQVYPDNKKIKKALQNRFDTLRREYGVFLRAAVEKDILKYLCENSHMATAPACQPTFVDNTSETNLSYISSSLSDFCFPSHEKDNVFSFFMDGPVTNLCEPFDYPNVDDFASSIVSFNDLFVSSSDIPLPSY